MVRGARCQLRVLRGDRPTSKIGPSALRAADLAAWGASAVCLERRDYRAFAFFSEWGKNAVLADQNAF